MPSGQCWRSAGGDVLGPVVHRRVEAEVVDEPCALLVAAGDAHDTAGPLDPGDLARPPTGGAGRAGHDHRVALGHPAHVEQAEVRRHARDPEDD